MRNKNFYNAGQAHSYLGGSIIRLNDEPIYAVEVTPANRKLLLRYIKLDDPHTPYDIPLDDEAINMEPVPLGMAVNKHPAANNHAHYLHRIPARQWKIGLSKNNLRGVSLKTGNLDRQAPAIYIPSRELAATIKGEYPRFNEAVNIVSRNLPIVPFSRMFAASYIDSRTTAILYSSKAIKVGTVTKSQPTLHDKYQYLQQVLEQVAC